MKIDLTKLLRVLGQIVVATPVVAGAIKPVVDELGKGKEP